MDLTCDFRGYVISDQLKEGFEYIKNPMHVIIRADGVEG
jgi:hypothetical protein